METRKKANSGLIDNIYIVSIIDTWMRKNFETFDETITKRNCNCVHILHKNA